MTKLSKSVSRETLNTYRARPVVVTIAPLGGQKDARIGFRLKGERTQYVSTVSALYRVVALWHGQKEAAAKKLARKNGIPWRVARKTFIGENSI